MRSKILAGLALSAVAMAPSIANANLTMTVKAYVDGTYANDATSVNVSAGQVVSLDIFAVVTAPAGAGVETFTAASGSIQASTAAGSLLGSLARNGTVSGFVPVTPFSSSEYQGSLLDTNSDTFIDRIGAANGAANNAYVYGKAGSAQSLGTNGGSILWGQVTFTVDPNATAGSSTTVTFVPQYNSTGGNVISGATWAENGTSMSALSGVYAGSPVTLTIPGSVDTPEPASLGLLALGGLAILRRRR